MRPKIYWLHLMFLYLLYVIFGSLSIIVVNDSYYTLIISVIMIVFTVFTFPLVRKDLVWYVPVRNVGGRSK